jgi:thiol-disulfide isomerase/thioredoxin
MTKSRGRRVAVVVVLVVGVVAVGAYIAKDSIEGLIFSTVYGSRGEWELVKVGKQFAKGELQEPEARGRIMEIASENPGSQAGFGANAFVAMKWPETADAETALVHLQKDAKTMSIDDLASCFDRRHLEGGVGMRPIATILIARVEQEPRHPRAAKLLSEAAIIHKPTDRDVTAPTELVQIADLIQERYATSSDLANFCEIVCNLGDPAGWMRPFEPHVRHILQVNQDRFVQCSAHFALATIVRSNGIERQDEARQIYEGFLNAFDGETSYPAQSVEQKLRQASEQALKIIGTHGLGMAVPETQGVDLDGKEISLNDYRGRVVLVSFWATWCGPCIQAIPHERKLIERFGEENFTILGMNADDNIEKAKAAAEKHGITWRSLHVKDARFVNNWTISGYPTFCLLNRDGRIAGLWTGLPPDAELIPTIRGLIDAPASK